MSELWELDKYQADIISLINRTIIEYDMKSANTSLAKEFHLLPMEKIKELEAMGKRSRNVAVGKIKRSDPTYQAKEKVAFAEARRMFFEMNDVKDTEIIAIKRDAIFLNRYVPTTKVGTYINFRPKNEYTSFVYLKPLEIYYSKNGLDIKGMNDEVYLRYHKEYFGHFISSTIRILENCSKEDAERYITDVFDAYKWRKLDSGYYREFNNTSQFRYLNGEVSMEEYMEDLSALDISHNFKLIIQLLRTII